MVPGRSGDMDNYVLMDGNEVIAHGIGDVTEIIKRDHEKFSKVRELNLFYIDRCGVCTLNKVNIEVQPTDTFVVKFQNGETEFFINRHFSYFEGKKWTMWSADGYIILDVVFHDAQMLYGFLQSLNLNNVVLYLDGCRVEVRYVSQNVYVTYEQIDF
jgi:hypothetical protein